MQNPSDSLGGCKSSTVCRSNATVEFKVSILFLRRTGRDPSHRWNVSQLVARYLDSKISKRIINYSTSGNGESQVSSKKTTARRLEIQVALDLVGAPRHPWR